MCLIRRPLQRRAHPLGPWLEPEVVDNLADVTLISLYADASSFQSDHSVRELDLLPAMLANVEGRRVHEGHQPALIDRKAARPRLVDVLIFAAPEAVHVRVEVVQNGALRQWDVIRLPPSTSSRIGKPLFHFMRNSGQSSHEQTSHVPR